MKKFKAILLIILLFVIIYFLQINFFSWFTFRGISPNLFIGFVLLIGLFVGKKQGALFGAIFGLILDFTIGKDIGTYTILLSIIGLFGEYLDKNFSKDSLISLIIMCSIATILFEIGYYAVLCIRDNLTPEILKFLIILITETLYNGLLLIIFYPLIKKIGYYMENIFKGKKLLTRYY